MTNKTQNLKSVCIVGLGYIGLPTLALLAENKVKVHGVDVNQSVVDTINKGEIHIVEPGLADIVRKGVKDGYIIADTEPKASDVYLIVVPTPFKGNNEPDISYVEAATRAVIPFLKEGDTFIIESTSPVGTTEKMALLIASERPDLLSNETLGENSSLNTQNSTLDTQNSTLDTQNLTLKTSPSSLKVNIAYCPERVLPGNVMYELVNNDRVIGGINEKSTEMACNFYKLFVEGELHPTNARTAEMCKLTENASRDAQIAFANELSLICDKADIDVWELIKLANKHPRVNILQPGCGVGGHCIAVDPWFIVADYPLESRMIGTARAVNNHKSFWCAEKIIQTIKDWRLRTQNSSLNTQNSIPKVALMGLAFKPNIDDLRESPAKYIVSKVLQHENECEFMIVEPNIKDHPIYKLTDYKTAFKEADIIVFLVAHGEFKEINVKSNTTVLDFCGINDK